MAVTNTSKITLYTLIAAAAALLAPNALAQTTVRPVLCWDGSIVYPPRDCPLAPNPTPGSSTPAPAPTKTPVPTAASSPVLLGAVQIRGTISVTLSWKAPASTGGSPITAYVATTYLHGAKISTATFSSSGLSGAARCAGVQGDTCRFNLVAVNAVGSSAPSNTVSVVLGEIVK